MPGYAATDLVTAVRIRSAEAEYEAADAVRMTLRQLKILSIVVPIVAVGLLETVRYSLIGPVPLGKRIALDLAAVAGIFLFSSFIFRFVGAIQDRLRRQNEELLALHKSGLAISSELSLDSVLKNVVEQARVLLQARYGALSVIDSDGRIRQFITAGISPENERQIGPPPVGHGVLGVTLREGQVLRLADVAKHPRSQGFPPNHPVMRTLLAVPIRCKSPFRGNIYVSEKESGEQFSESDQDTLERLAVQAAIAIDNAHLHQQASDLAVAQERLRISHEMHDGLAQVLGYVNTKVQAADAYLQKGKSDEASAQLKQLADAARGAYTDVREGIVGLRVLPGPDRPLAAVVREYAERWKEQSGIGVEVAIDESLTLRPVVELQLVRVIQEALTNVRKHSRATSVRVEVRRVNGTVTTTISDDGIGFDQASKTRHEFPRFGLSTMRERAESVGGTLTVDSAPGKGTAIRFDVQA